MNEQAREQLEIWQKVDANNCLPISNINKRVVSVDTDASDVGYGWYYQNDIVSEAFSKECQELHINVKELWALMKFVEKEGPELKDRLLCWRCDNNTALAAIRK